MPKTILSRIQSRVWRSTARFKVLIWGRRSGKSHLAKLWLFDGALKRPGTDNWFVSTTQRNVKKHHFSGPGDIRRIIPEGYVAHVNQVDMILTLKNGSRILLGGRENADNMRGGGVFRLVNDEFAVQENAADRGLETWQEVLLPMMAEFDGEAILSTTPKGYNFGYDFYIRGQEDEYPTWESWQYTTVDSGRFTLDQLDELKASMDPRSWRQEFEASFETVQGRVYYTFDRKIHVDDSVEDTGAELYIGQDFNVHPMASAIAVKAGPEIHFIADMLLPESNTEEVAAEVKRRYPGRTIIFCPDATGSKRATSSPMGQTDLKILKDAGFEVRAPKANPLVVDRENNTNANLRAADGTVRVKFHPRCKALIRAYEGLTYKEGTSQRDKQSGLDHICDAADYLLWQESNLVKPKRTMRVGSFSI